MSNKAKAPFRAWEGTDMARTYMGVNIYRNEPGANRLRYYTVSPSLAADTLEGIKALIRAYKERN